MPSRRGPPTSPAKGNSSIGRALVSKTSGWGFESLLPCASQCCGRRARRHAASALTWDSTVRVWRPRADTQAERRNRDGDERQARVRPCRQGSRRQPRIAPLRRDQPLRAPDPRRTAQGRAADGSRTRALHDRRGRVRRDHDGARVNARLRSEPTGLLGLHRLGHLRHEPPAPHRDVTAGRHGRSTSKEVGQSVSEQFAHEGAPNGESTESDVVDPAVETDDVSASDVESGAEDDATDSDLDTVEAETDDESGDESGDDVDAAVDSETSETSGDDEPVAQGSGDPVADFKADLRTRFGDWYVIHSYAGYENRVKANLETRIQTLNMEDFIFEIE